jgi:hypothetical protein
MFCRAAYDLAVRELPKLGRNYLEIGVFAGDAVNKLAGLFPAVNFHGIDPFIEDGYTTHTTNRTQGQVIPVQQQQARANFNARANAYLHEMTSEQFDHDYADLVLNQLDVGFVLIDGDHHLAPARLDGALAMRLIGSGAGVVVWDDCNLPEVGQARDQWLEQYRDRIESVADISDAHPGHILAYRIGPSK